MKWQRLIKWYRGLHWGWQIFAWVVPLLAGFFIFVLPWLLSSRYRAQVVALKAEAALGDAKHAIAGAKEDIEVLEDRRDEALDREKDLADQENQVDKDIAAIDDDLEEKKKKAKEQTDEERTDFFNQRYRGGGRPK